MQEICAKNTAHVWETCGIFKAAALFRERTAGLILRSFLPRVSDKASSARPHRRFRWYGLRFPSQNHTHPSPHGHSAGELSAAPARADFSGHSKEQHSGPVTLISQRGGAAFLCLLFVFQRSLHLGTDAQEIFACLLGTSQDDFQLPFLFRGQVPILRQQFRVALNECCLLYTYDAADDCIRV